MSSPTAEPLEPAGTEDRLAGCRICLEPFAEHFDSIENPELWDQIETVFYFPIKFMEQLPEGVCKMCTDVIQGFHTFSEKICSNQHQLISELTANPEEPKKDEPPSPRASAENGVGDQHDMKLHTEDVDDPPVKRKRKKRKTTEKRKANSSEAGEKEPKSNRLASNTEPRSHLSNMHADKDQLMICDTCGKGFLNKTWLERHVKEHIGIKLIKCHTCHKWFKGKEGLLKHIWVAHYKYVCDICGKNCQNANAIWQHKAHAHVEKKFECEFCGKNFNRPYKLKEHRTTHTGEALHACEFCNAPIYYKKKPKYTPQEVPPGGTRQKVQTDCSWESSQKD